MSSFASLFVITPLFSQNCLAMANPLGAPDHQIANWFHGHLTHSFVTFLRLLSEPGSALWIGVVVFLGVLFFVWKKHWPALATFVIAVPGGMLLNELIKILVHRPRPFVAGPFVDWSGYSFASGHTIGATLLYGQLALFLVPAIKGRRWRALTTSGAVVVVVLVGFSRIALGAHYLTDVLAAMVFGLLWLALCLFAGKPIRRSPALPMIMPEVEAAILVPVEESELPARPLVS